MAYVPRSSIIQNSPGVVPLQIKKKRTIRLFSVLTTIAFAFSLIGSVGVFVYKDFTEKQLTAAKEALGDVSTDENEQKIQEVYAYDRKLTIAHTLLDNHLSPARLLTELESTTKHNVRYTRLDYTYDPGFEAVVTLTGDTEELEAVALQKMQLLKEDIFSQFYVKSITSVIEIAEEGTDAAINSGVQFTVTGIFERDALKYTGEGTRDTFSTQTVPEVEIPEPVVEEGVEVGTTTDEVINEPVL